MGGWPRIAGLRVVMSWPDSEFAPEPPPRGRGRVRLAGFAGVCLVFGGVAPTIVRLPRTEAWLSERSGRRVQVLVPKRGEKRGLR